MLRSMAESKATEAGIAGKLLARNVALSVAGQIVPLGIGLVTLPFIIHGLGADRFGILSLALILVSYFSGFDLGIGRATTRFVAQYLGANETDHVRSIVTTSLALVAALGIVGGMILAALIPVLVTHVFRIPPELVGEATSSLLLVAAWVPAAISTLALRGVLEAAQRFDLVSWVSIPSSCFNYLVPAIGIALGLGLPTIVLSLLAVQVCAAVAFLALSVHAIPALRSALSREVRLERRLLRFGAWVTVSNVVTPVLVYLDRFLISWLLGLAALSYYVIPYELATKLLILPIGFSAALFPAFSLLSSRPTGELQRIFVAATKYVVLTMGVGALVVCSLAADVLQVWLGGEFVREGTRVLQILAVGMLVSSLAYVPYAYLHATERPDVTAKFHLLELGLFLLGGWALISTAGIAGAALAWALRAALDAVLLFGTACRLLALDWSSFMHAGMLRALLALAGLGTAGLLARVGLGEDLAVQGIVLASLVLGFAVVVWAWVFDQAERRLFGVRTHLLASIAHRLGTR
ncbi:MAG: flippase [Chloroflexi bacterium]|nr:flippase [Chloroflexota bacterium]